MSLAATAGFVLSILAAIGSPPQNTMTVSGAAEQSATNYPMQFGRPFVQGAIPHSPQVLANGVVIPSQADVKNRYPDGSVEFAVIAAQIPQVSASDCTVVAASPAEAPPYTLWPAHGNSPVFTIGPNPTTDPVWQILETDKCHHFDGNVPRTSFGVEFPNHVATSAVPAGGIGFTEEGTKYEANGIAQAADYPAPTTQGLIYTCGPWTGPTVPTTYSNPGILIGCDIEGGGGQSWVVIPPNKDIVFASTYSNGQECIQVAGQGAPVCAPSLIPVINTQGNFSIGPDGDHNVSFEGGDTVFDSIFAQGVLPAATINAVNAAQATYYATSGSASPVECSNFGFTCSQAHSLTHKMVSTATTPYQLYNISAGTYRDADFDSKGNSDTAADLAFCGTVANCRLFKVYDQMAEGQSGPIVLTFQDTTTSSTPLTVSQMEVLLPVGAAAMTLTPGGTADAGQMLLDGNCKPWTQGSVAQTMICADDSATRKYDIGTGDGYHPFRPRFYVTFWPGSSQVFVRAVGENGLTTEQEDLAYSVTMSDGYTANLTGTQTTNPKKHWANSRWTHTFWLGGAPIQKVNIDPNLAYLSSTRFLPNYDTSIHFAPSPISTGYSAWTAAPHDIYDGYWDADADTGWWNWQTAMGAAGNSFHIGPFPLATTMWLLSADYRLRTIAENYTDLAGAFPMDIRESDPTRIFQRGDVAGSGTGLGRVFSAAGRPTLWDSYSGDPNNLKYVGTISGNQWSGDDAHEPSVWFPAYVMTGDPWYLDMMYAWAGWEVFEDTVAPGYDCTNQSTNPPCSIYRGPSGAYGGLNSKAPRAIAWTLRGRGETSFAAPDGTPEKNYFRYMTLDALAKWEGGWNISGTPLDGATIKAWIKTAVDPNFFGSFDAQTASTPPPLGNMDSGFCTPPTTLVACGIPLTVQQSEYNLVPGVSGSIDNPWMNHYLADSLGRLSELGFPSKPLQAYIDQFPIGIIGSTNPWFLGAYGLGVEKAAGGYWPDWPTYFANAADPTSLANLAANGPASVGPGGYLVTVSPGLAMAVDQNVSGAAAAWAWYKTNIYNIAVANGTWLTDPRYAILPRTDTNVLPPVSTLTPP